MLQRLQLDFVENVEFDKEGERVLADYWSLAGGVGQCCLRGTKGGTGAELPLETRKPMPCKTLRA